MLKLHRGLFAAGLAVAVVGAIGAAPSLSALADEKVQAVDDGPGGRDGKAAELRGDGQPIRIGKAGASSAELRAAGLDAAPAADGEASGPRARSAPKGRFGGSSTLRSGKTTYKPRGMTTDSAKKSTVAPQPPTAETKAADVPVYYYYGASYADSDGDSFASFLKVGTPTVGEPDYHSLAELAVQSADRQQVIEVGWTVDPSLYNGSTDAHLFVYHWINGVGQCYNVECKGFVQKHEKITPGMTLADDAVMKFSIVYQDGNWWIKLGSDGIGYFPDTLWKGSFTRGAHFLAYGEVASTRATNPCSEMGNGALPVDVNSLATAFSTNTVSDSLRPTEKLTVNYGISIQQPDKATSKYGVFRLGTGKSFLYGGPGDKC